MHETRESMLRDIKQRIADNRIMLFLKGTLDQPSCGFSAATAQLLRQLGQPFAAKNVLEQPEYRYVLAEHSRWPTIPQVFVDGQLVGGCDAVHELAAGGELHSL